MSLFYICCVDGVTRPSLSVSSIWSKMCQAVLRRDVALMWTHTSRRVSRGEMEEERQVMWNILRGSAHTHTHVPISTCLPAEAGSVPHPHNKATKHTAHKHKHSCTQQKPGGFAVLDTSCFSFILQKMSYLV